MKFDSGRMVTCHHESLEILRLDMLYFLDLVWTLVTVIRCIVNFFIQVCDAGAGQRHDRFSMFTIQQK